MSTPNQNEGSVSQQPGADSPLYPHDFTPYDASPKFCMACGRTKSHPRHADAGDVVALWHDTVAMGAQLVYARVIKRGPKMLQVQRERSSVLVWKRPEFFDHIERDARLIADVFSSDSGASR